MAEINNYIHYFKKIVLSILFLLLIFSLFISWNTPSKGFEGSIYQSTPMISWLCLILTMVFGLFLLLSSINKKKKSCDDKKFLIKEFLLIYLIYAISLSIFIIRSYYMWCINGDTGSHLGWTNEIISTGYVPKSLIYPATHILLSTISITSTSNLIILHKVIPLTFSLFCVIFIYIFSKLIFENKIIAILAATISCLLPYGWYLNLTPNHLATLFFPLVLFCLFAYYQYKKITWGIILLIFILFYPIFHLVPTLFFFICLISILIFQNHTKYLMAETLISDKKINNTINLKALKILLVIAVIWTIFWVSHFSLFEVSLEGIYYHFSLENSDSHITSLLDQISIANSLGINTLEIVLKKMSVHGILIFFSLIAFPIILKEFKSKYCGHKALILFVPFGFLLIFIPFFYLLNLPFDPTRLIVYISILGTLFSAFVFFYFFNYLDIKLVTTFPSMRTIIVYIVLISLFFLGFLNLYSSPYNLSVNLQTTKHEIDGMDFLFKNRDIEKPITAISAGVGRHAFYLLSPSERNHQNLPTFLNDEDKVPWHFGYDKSYAISSSYYEDKYLVINAVDTKIYSEYFKNIERERFTENDFKKLDYDPSLNFLYSNGEYFIREINTN